jgi:hypothetical protein
LVGDTETVLRDLCSWLGLSFDAGMLEWYESESASRQPRRDPQAIDANKPMNFAPVGRWKRDMPLEARQLFKNMTGGLLQGLGYCGNEKWWLGEEEDSDA